MNKSTQLLLLFFAIYQLMAVSFVISAPPPAIVQFEESSSENFIGSINVVSQAIRIHPKRNNNNTRVEYFRARQEW